MESLEELYNSLKEKYKDLNEIEPSGQSEEVNIVKELLESIPPEWRKDAQEYIKYFFPLLGKTMALSQFDDKDISFLIRQLIRVMTSVYSDIYEKKGFLEDKDFVIVQTMMMNCFSYFKRSYKAQERKLWGKIDIDILDRFYPLPSDEPQNELPKKRGFLNIFKW